MGSLRNAASHAEVIRGAVREAMRAGSGADLVAAIMAIPADELDVFLHASFVGDGDRELLTTGLGASPGAASGEIVLTADAAVAAAEAGRAVILVRNETSPDDVLGMQSSAGVLTTRGGITSHAAVVARGWGIPAVVGAGELVIDDEGVHLDDRVLRPGQQISIDGRTGQVYLGSAETSVAEEAPDEIVSLLAWADTIRHRADRPVLVRANADNAADAAHARRMGAEGIGLCRTEHMFLAEDRLPLVRRFILTDDPAEATAALADLEAAQEHDFEALLGEMSGLPVTVRLLDPPLHEFLPSLEQLIVAEATGELDAAGHAELAAVRRMHEVNPMIGTRGVRLGVIKPGVYEMQVRALFRAVMALADRGVEADVEVMIPLVVDPTEMHLARRWVAESLADIGCTATPQVGAMLETPRAAIVAGELSEVSDFFSFGTNDLTQLTLALSRDDVGSKLIPEYVRRGLLPADPFEALDQIGVGRIIRVACEHARAAKPGIKIGVCGEQGGHPESARFLVQQGVDYVSCSPYRVPIARLAVAQGLIEAGRVGDDVFDEIAAELAAANAAGVPGGSAAEPARPSSAPSASTGTAVPSAAPASAAADAGDHHFLVMHALRVKGFAAPDVLGEIAGLDPADTVAVLEALAGAELTKHIPARNLWQLTPTGRARHAEQLAARPAAETAGLHEPYEAFLAHNVEFKDLCNRWQMRGQEPNDHTDSAYDDERLGELDALHEAAAPVVAQFVGAVARFDTYRRRLADALARIHAGETKMFTGVMCGSFHDVWMELHEDLVQLLGVDRHAEGSY